MTKKLTAALARDDQREAAGMHGDDRDTCHTHQTWADQCDSRHQPVNAGTLLAEQRQIDRTRASRT